MRVVISSSNPLARAGLAALLGEQELPEVVAQVDPGEAAATTVESDAAVLLHDIGGADTDALDLLADLVEALPGIPVVAVSGPPGKARAAMAMGAAGAVGSESSGPTLVAALHAAISGLSFLPRGEADFLLGGPGGHAPSDLPVEALTPRELDVLQLLASGMTTRRIAHALEISEHTVKFHVTSILGKLGASTRAEAVARAAGLGLILV